MTLSRASPPPPQSLTRGTVQIGLLTFVSSEDILNSCIAASTDLPSPVMYPQQNPRNHLDSLAIP